MYNNNRKYIYKEEEEERIDETGEGRLRGGCVRFPSSTPQGSFYLVDGNTQTKKRKKTKKKKNKTTNSTCRKTTRAMRHHHRFLVFLLSAYQIISRIYL